ncbi:MAG: hypothetical protein LCH92_08270 [Proteobacteria bacterium]|nr:hypothetical protein [Pseudomonadota bacterium]
MILHIIATILWVWALLLAVGTGIAHADRDRDATIGGIVLTRTCASWPP